MVYPCRSRLGSHRNPGLPRSGLSKGGRRKTPGTRHSEKEVVEQVAYPAAQDGLGRTHRWNLFRIDRDPSRSLGGVADLPNRGLMKAVNVWRVEETPVRRGLLRRAIGCTASEKE